MEATIPRDGSNIYSAPSGTTAVSGTPVASAPYNAFVSDLTTDLNAARPISAGGTGATTAAGARTALGVSATDATITAIAALDFSVAGSMLYSTAADTFSLLTSTVAGRALLTAADAAAQRTALGVAIGTDVQGYDAGLAALATFNTNGILCQTANNTFAGRTLTGTSAEITVTNGDGVSGAPTFSLPTALTFTGKTITGGTYASPTLSGTVGGSPTASGVWTWSSSSVQTFNGDIQISKATAGLDLISTGSNITNIQLRNASRYDDIRNTTSGLEFRTDTSGTPRSMVLTSSGLQTAISVSSETSGTLTSASSNKQVNASGDITINDGVHAAGDRIEIYAGASARSIVQDTGMTIRLDGTATTGTRSLAARGRIALYFVSNSEAIASGMGVT